MKFQQAIAEYKALKTIYSQLDIQTSMGRKLLLDTEFSLSKAWIEQQWREIDECTEFIESQNEQNLHRFFCLLNSICDINGTVRLIEQEGIADDVALFELKVFCINVKKLKKQFDTPLMPLPDLQEAIEILDPEGLEQPSFHVYSAYSDELLQLRTRWEKARNENQDEESRLLYLECLKLEEAIRERLCKKLFVQVPKLKQALRNIALIDLAFAKALLAKELKL